jgi:small GTP-binding protein
MNDLYYLNDSIIKFGRPMKRRKILILGSKGSGKSSLIKRFKDNTFEEIYESTIQNNIKKLIQFNNERIELEIIDFDGQTEYTLYTPNKFSFGINGYILVYEIINRKSFELVKNIIKELNSFVGKKFPKILIGTKSDNKDTNNKREVSYNEGLNFANQIKCPFLECSSKDNKNVEKAFLTLLIEINKIETGFEPKSLYCYLILSFLVRNEYLMRFIFYIILFFNLIIGIYWFYYGVNKEIKAELNERGLFVFLMIYGIWTFIFSIIGINGLKNCLYEKINLNKIGNIFSLIIIFIGILYYYMYKPDRKEVKNEINKIEIIISSILNLINIVFSNEFKIIYEMELLNYII